MKTDIETLLKDNAPGPDQVAPLDLDAARRHGRRRRAVKRVAGAGGAAGLLTVVAVAAVQLAGAPDVQIEGPGFAGDGQASPAQSDPAEPEQSGDDWSALSLSEAAEQLQDIAAAHAALPEPAPGQIVEIRTVGVETRGRVDDQGYGSWLGVIEIGQRRSGDGSLALLRREVDQMPAGTSLEQIRTRVASMEPAPSDAWELVDGPPPTDDALEEAEQLAYDPDPVEPRPHETERPQRVYALERLGDALRQGLGDTQVLVRGFDVLLAVGEEHLDYRGMVTDVLGRDGVGFSYDDPANNGMRTLFVFDPDTGRLNGTIVTVDPDSTNSQVFTANANLYTVEG